MARLSGAGPEVTRRQPSRTPSRSVSVEQQDVSHENTPPFFNTTFSTHRVSPLYIGAHKLDTKRLDQLASRLRDTLVGDVVRGVQIGLESTETETGRQVGPLKEIRIRRFKATDVLGEEGREEATRPKGKGKNKARSDGEEGLWIHIRHENAAYNALMLPAGGRPQASGWKTQPFATNDRNNAQDANEKHFLSLPLLLLRMPQPLKVIISEWIASTFDCRVSKVTLGTRTLVELWESWIREMGILSKGPDFVMTLAFTLPASTRRQGEQVSDSEDELSREADAEDQAFAEPGLRSIDVTINPQDLRRFARAGEDLMPVKAAKQAWDSDPRERRMLAGPNTDDGWSWRSSPAARAEQPFTEALARYLQHHLALDMFHPGVRVVQISCGGFVLAQSRLKVVRIGRGGVGGDEGIGDQLSRGAWAVVMRLGERVEGEGLPDIFQT